MWFTPTLAQCLFPSRSIAREITVVLAGALVIFAFAQLRIDIWPVPVTGQTLGVLLVGAAFGFRRGSAAAIAYVAAGLCGAPVFAGWGGGFAHLMGPTGGYLIGFILSAGVIGLLAEHGFLRNYARAVLAMVIATVPVFLLGLAWLMNFLAPGEAFYSGFVIFIPGALIKIAIAAWIMVPLSRRARHAD